MVTCKMCLLNSVFPNIRFDDTGVCNFCRHYEKYASRIENRDFLRKSFVKRIERIKRLYEYDCLLGISGGKDSSYVLYMLKNRYKLRVLTYTFDNGFLSDYALENINNMVSSFGVDHFFYKPDWEFHKKLYRYMMKVFGIPCKGCSVGAYGTSFKFAFERNIPLVVHGRTPAQIFREFAPESSDPAVPFVESNLLEFDEKRNLQTLMSVVERLTGLLSGGSKEKSGLMDEMIKVFFPDFFEVLGSDMIPEFLGYFIYHDYNEDFIKKFLGENTIWKPSEDESSSHSDCLIHDAVEYIRYKMFGYTILRPELSVAVRQGRISREEALKLVETEESSIRKPGYSLKVLCERLDLDCNTLLGELNK
ncbi:MAG: hypothetical protein J7L32_04750 [Thermoplasmata archaeon]|nr:hypothetical protein [Thermoplasmata archaeon]